ncbi:hypothetical protein [Flavobacterium glaciei]|uniref:Uncharacterized protein n=1 Tax=Flavobacterium glaciei TaxID=386300 RepID=A0A562PXQ8_9FLAO|nr:hypothetical protein [Flavobacterium glaciei]RDI56637.1 hypothetical protein DFR66_104203 [Flavobacterium glaciei]TWI49207.1 hypothetical protein IQ02_01196 [Flavobacterium glaciei]
MKRIASLFLIVTLFYNALGYYLMFAYQEEQAWVASIEKKQDSEFQVIQLNATLYSFIEDTDFEYVNEDVVINNKSYHIFKKRIQNNILSLYYLRNSHQDAISQDLKDIVDNQLFNGSSSKESPVKKLMKSFLHDYIPSNTYCLDFSTKKVLHPTESIITPNQSIDSGYISLSYSPPDFV